MHIFLPKKAYDKMHQFFSQLMKIYYLKLSIIKEATPNNLRLEFRDTNKLTYLLSSSHCAI